MARILFLGKRFPQQRDLIARPYGRFHHIPTALAAMGHDVRVILCSHRRLPSMALARDGVQWSSLDLRTLGPRGLLAALDDEAERLRPHWVIGCSDAWYGPLAQRIARRAHARLGIDAYDNYEAYMRWNLPLHWAWRRAVHAADLVTAAGPQLADLLQSHRRGAAPVRVLPMAADPEFVPMDRRHCRDALGLPVDSPLVGYVGSWTRTRGSHLIIEAFDRARARRPELRLVLSGKPPIDVLHHPGIISVGYVTDAQLPKLVNALDVAWIVTADTAFGRYSYPAKLCEAMACSVPVVASATAAIVWMLDGRSACLAPIGDAEAIATQSLASLATARIDYGPIARWPVVARSFAQALQEA